MPMLPPNAQQQMMAQMLARGAGPQGAPMPQAGPPPMPEQGAGPDPAAGGPMDPQQAQQVLQQLGITQAALPMVVRAIQTLMQASGPAPPQAPA